MVILYRNENSLKDSPNARGKKHFAFDIFLEQFT